MHSDEPPSVSVCLLWKWEDVFKNTVKVELASPPTAPPAMNVSGRRKYVPHATLWDDVIIELPGFSSTDFFFSAMPKICWIPRQAKW